VTPLKNPPLRPLDIKVPPGPTLHPTQKFPWYFLNSSRIPRLIQSPDVPFRDPPPRTPLKSLLAAHWHLHNTGQIPSEQAQNIRRQGLFPSPTS
jgi:hypothetical protein